MTAQATRPMAADIHTFDQLNSLTHMNGVPISTIEERARPGRWSMGGFLNGSERLLHVMKRDWDTVASLGLTHVELAEHIDQLIRAGASIDPQVRFGNREVTVDFDSSKVRESRLSNLHAEMNKTQKSVFSRFFEIISIRASTLLKTEGVFNKLKYFFESFAAVFTHTFNGGIPTGPGTVLTRIRYKEDASTGCQDDIFCRGQANGHPVDGVVSGHWHRDYTFTNVETGEEITIAYGLLEYIRRFGFYEGSVAYRADPLKLVSVLTGASVSSLQAYQRQLASQ
ncbi:MAG: hypothetical protein JSS60_02430 [Verrucomicrobia bacterium]|nr:hypothetical protein [Verrucomicrobiota bacterium]